MSIGSLFCAKISVAKRMHIFHKSQNIENRHTGAGWSFVFWGRLSIDFIYIYTLNSFFFSIHKAKHVVISIFYAPSFFPFFVQINIFEL